VNLTGLWEKDPASSQVEVRSGRRRRGRRRRRRRRREAAWGRK
jgi:hypothetical protein